MHADRFGESAGWTKTSALTVGRADHYDGRVPRKSTLLQLIAAFALVSGCNGNEATTNGVSEISSDIKKQRAFVCSYEKDRIPPPDAEADQLYRRARWLRKNNLLEQDPSVYPSIERLVRIATAYGHDKANIELRRMLEAGQAKSDDSVNETIDLVQDLIKRGIPAGYYDMGWYLEHGYGMKADSDLAFKHYRKSADLGSPEGQHLVGSKLADLPRNGAEISTIGRSMHRCAAEQGHAGAAYEYALYLQFTDRLADATKYLQIASRAGSSTAALGLSRAFSAGGNSNKIDRLGQAVDAERDSRYAKMNDLLHRYEYLHPTVAEIDEIVPLPPAPLPAWNGKFKWLEDHEANVPPLLPSEERISEMARAKGLDPKSGRVLAK